jgi:phage regulator Rha-like protein
MKQIVHQDFIEKLIFHVRDKKVMLDAHLAEIYSVPTKVLVQAVKRNINRFPKEFMFQLSDVEYQLLRSQFVTSKKGRGGRRYLPYVFTEHGVAMLATVLNSKRAVQMSIIIVKTFVRLRELLSTNKEFREKLHLLETKVDNHDQEIQTIIEAIRQLMLPPEKPKRQIGFRVEEPKAKYVYRRRKI